ncbi:MAG: lantibiotic immunity ABC transporter MutE/EpiE family permease subunit [Agathobacter sp.]|nr:lantibiotic immunity ABC transporter MutE/EpiE family permease subunit [Agathobacter sp.]
MQYIKAENLKCRHTMLNHLLLIAPIITVLFAFLAGGLNIFQSTGMYWWYMFILQGMIAVLCYFSVRIEEVSGNGKIVYSLPVNLKKIKFAKNLLMVGKLVIAHMVLIVLLMAVAVILFPDYVVYTFTELLLGNIVIVFTSMWQIPFCFIMMKKLGMFVPIVINTLMGLITIVFIGNTSFWYIWPYCWSAKEMESFLRININGVAQSHVESIGIGNVIVIIMAIILFFVFTELDAKLFEKGGEHK